MTLCDVLALYHTRKTPLSCMLPFITIAYIMLHPKMWHCSQSNWALWLQYDTISAFVSNFKLLVWILPVVVWLKLAKVSVSALSSIQVFVVNFCWLPHMTVKLLAFAVHSYELTAESTAFDIWEGYFLFPPAFTDCLISFQSSPLGDHEYLVMR